MKKNLFFSIFAFTIVFFAVSCSKTNTPAPPAAPTVQGNWVGYYNIPNGGPSKYFALTFNAAGALVVNSDNQASPSVANGTWVQGVDSVRSTYTFIGGPTSTYSLAGKFISTSTTMNGTIGNGTNTGNAGSFQVIKQ